MLAKADHIASLPPGQAFTALSDTLVDSMMGGSSGFLYAYFFSVIGRSLGPKPLQELGLQDWARGLAEATQALSERGGAGRGDRTMLDALFPASDALGKLAQTAKDAVAGSVVAAAAAAAAAEVKQAAAEGAEGTRRMRARAGRSSYVAEEKLVVPDPGAVAVAVWMGAVADVLGEKE